MPIYATQKRALQAIRELNDEEMDMLVNGARKHLGGTEFTEGHDLLNEAFCRLLRPRSADDGDALDPGAAEPADEDGTSEGRPRRWPLHMQFGPCVQLIMRSIATSSRARFGNHPGRRADLDAADRAGASSGTRGPAAQDEAERRESTRVMELVAARARDALRGDPDAQKVVDGWVAGLERHEACDELGILPRLYEPARKRAQRVLRRIAEVTLGPELGLFDPRPRAPGSPHG